MRKPASMKALEELGRVRLSEHFFMREMLTARSRTSTASRISRTIPTLRSRPERGSARSCSNPCTRRSDTCRVRSAFRSVEVNTYGAERQDKGYSCGKTDWNRSRHVWDRRDAEGCMGATACIVIPWFIPRYEAGTWHALAWWIHDHLPYSDMMFFAVKGKNCAFNLRWHERPARRIEAYARTGFSSPNGDGRSRGRSRRGISRVPGARGATERAVLPFPSHGA